MFIETKKSGEFLAKRVAGKVFLVKILDGKINEQLLEKLTLKESEYIYSSESFKNFDKEIYNSNLLKELVYKSKFFSNNIEVLELLEKKFNNIKNIINKKLSEDFNEVEILYLQGNFMKNYLDKNFAIKFIHNSNNIEGSKIPEEEVEKIIKEKKYIYKVKNEIIEVKNSKKLWDFINTKFIFNEANIKKLYHILTKDLLKSDGLPYPRGFKKVENVVNNTYTTKPENVSSEIKNLINNYKKNKKIIFPFQNAFDFHLNYEQIHPFEDGNGRTGRFLMNKILLQNGFLPMIIFKENYKGYSQSIASCQKGNNRKYYKFMLTQYKKTIEELYDFKIGMFEEYNKVFKELDKINFI